MPRLSVIIPTLNEAEGIAATLGPLQALRALGHELILVDGGSIDGTPERARGSVDVLLSAPRGRASQMNAGARAASGDVLLFLHADTRLPEGGADLVLQGLERGDRDWGRFDVRIEGRSRLLCAVAFLANLRSRASGIATGDQAIFVRRQLFDAVGGFAPLELMEDVELSARLKRRCRPLCLRAKVTTSGRRWEENGVLRTVLLMWWLRLRFFLGAAPATLARKYHRNAGQ